MSRHGLTDRAPLRLHLRYAFHDWMWSGGSKNECGWRRRLSRRLPTYFTDPDLDGLPKTRSQWAKFDAEHHWEPTLGPQDRLFHLVDPQVTTTSGSGSTFRYVVGPPR